MTRLSVEEKMAGCPWEKKESNTHSCYTLYLNGNTFEQVATNIDNIKRMFSEHVGKDMRGDALLGKVVIEYVSMLRRESPVYEDNHLMLNDERSDNLLIFVDKGDGVITVGVEVAKKK